MTDAYWEDAAGRRFEQVGCYDVPRDAKLVLVMGRRWAPEGGENVADAGPATVQGEAQLLEVACGGGDAGF